ncbi:MAG: hydrogenase maturation nickel metallochaperone HypA, partial [Deltaproteobacteria bacterium]|nr:hydrogenase maturation nickel metallochaperone HypA [Deltaproteobacteria bacterium]
LSGVVPEALEYCFPIAAASAGLTEAQLELRRLTAEASCPACDAQFDVDQMWACCPACEHVPVTVKGGTEFRLKEIEVSDV